MQYVIKAPAVANGVITLWHVADAMAHGIATAGDTPFHKPTYIGCFKRHAKWLLDDAKAGRLAVCDAYGRPRSVDELRDDDKNVVVLESFDPSNPDTSPVDEFETTLFAVCTREKWLNAWAAINGETFAIDHAGVAWIDERGDVIPPVQATTKPDGLAPVIPTTESERQASSANNQPVPVPETSPADCSNAAHPPTRVDFHNRGASGRTRSKPTVREAIAPYVARVMSENQEWTGERLYKHMRSTAGQDGSLFARLKDRAELFCIEASATCGIATVRAALTEYWKGKRAGRRSTVETPSNP